MRRRNKWFNYSKKYLKALINHNMAPKKYKMVYKTREGKYGKIEAVPVLRIAEIKDIYKREPI